MQKLTATEIRKVLFENKNLYAVVGSDEMNNNEARKHFFDLDYDTEFNVIENEDHLLIY